MGAILLNVWAILTGAILQWGDLTRYHISCRDICSAMQ